MRPLRGRIRASHLSRVRSAVQTDAIAENEGGKERVISLLLQHPLISVDNRKIRTRSTTSCNFASALGVLLFNVSRHKNVCASHRKNQRASFTFGHIARCLQVSYDLSRNVSRNQSSVTGDRSAESEMRSCLPASWTSGVANPGFCRGLYP